MNLYRLTPQAAADLFSIWSYIAAENSEAADRVETAVYDACAFLGDGPMGGQADKELTDRPVRFWTVQRYPNYLIIYDPHTLPLQIIRILHGMRDLRRILREPFE
jgi:plasmid stabilization system protein ParE